MQHSLNVDTELGSLEGKVAQFVSLCERLRAENTELRRQLAAAQGESKRLQDKVQGAAAKLEGLLSRIPG